ncbi:hypothetical protein PanWU01x14_292760 [Parasponia andersonii]|uniref:Uncharacterized protein n=1 Tax=Parasponia andersonii TaxID=3476 RepID=A0A2P5AWV4_PARAD|nr:hypothetical protein PanWU01x14_292760 [Parasponia andersonii]
MGTCIVFRDVISFTSSSHIPYGKMSQNGFVLGTLIDAGGPSIGDAKDVSFLQAQILFFYTF